MPVYGKHTRDERLFDTIDERMLGHQVTHQCLRHCEPDFLSHVIPQMLLSQPLTLRSRPSNSRRLPARSQLCVRNYRQFCSLPHRHSTYRQTIYVQRHQIYSDRQRIPYKLTSVRRLESSLPACLRVRPARAEGRRCSRGPDY